MIVFQIIFVILSIIFLYFLFVPITIYVIIHIDGKTMLFSGVKAFPFEFKLLPKKPGKPKPAKPKAAKIKKPIKEAEKKKKEGAGLSEITRDDVSILWRIFTNVLRFLLRLIFKAPDKYYLHAALKGGLDAPDVTGEFYGALQAIRPVLPKNLTISYHPDFLAEKLNGKVDCGVVFRLFRILLEVTILILRLPLIKLYKLYKKFNKGG